MQNNTIIILLTILLCGCSLSQQERNKTELINAISQCIDSGEFKGKIIGVYRLDYSYKDHDVYLIGQYYGIAEGEAYPYEIIQLKDKHVFLFSNKEKELPHDKVDKIQNELDEIQNNASTAFYFAQCKTSDKNLLVHAVNAYIEPYEIPEIRDFTCSDMLVKKNNIEIIVTDYNFDAVDNYITTHNDTMLYFPTNYTGIISIYNRTDSCIFFPMEEKYGKFAIVNYKDTLHLSTEEISLADMDIDDPDYKFDKQKITRAIISSEIDLSFFEKLINNDNYEKKILSLLRDSIFYLPNSSEYKEHGDRSFIYPKEKIKVITPIEAKYTFVTPKYRYMLKGERIFLKQNKTTGEWIKYY